jgi:hypothetical protein
MRICCKASADFLIVKKQYAALIFFKVWKNLSIIIKTESASYPYILVDEMT